KSSRHATLPPIIQRTPSALLTARASWQRKQTGSTRQTWQNRSQEAQQVSDSDGRDPPGIAAITA
ncbi:hypothetical protein, partial [Arthrobacter sp. HMWF013]|uniref:hypothetical protein n=1 Tax=Arthrobacter sp. HMWF013 TaxID=2056849 RepID=UPI001C62DFCF